MDYDLEKWDWRTWAVYANGSSEFTI